MHLVCLSSEALPLELAEQRPELLSRRYDQEVLLMELSPWTPYKTKEKVAAS
jgi:hypothetical protein